MKCPRKVFPRTKKAFTCLIVALSLLGIVGAAFGWDYYPTSYHWGFQNYCYLGFNQAMNFTDAPHQGVLYDSSLVGYWSMDEGTGSTVYDHSGNGNNGTITGASWVDGKYGKALSFDGENDYVKIPHHTSIDAFNYMTAMLWVKSDTVGRDDYLLSKQWRYSIARIGVTNQFVAYFAKSGEATIQLSSTTLMTAGTWYFIALTYNKDDPTTGSKLYVNGVKEDEDVTFDSLESTAQALMIGSSSEELGELYKGIIDEVCIYNRTLSAREVAALYAMDPYAQPDPVSFANYYHYTDPITNNTMLIHVDNPNANSNNVALVTCTNFFTDNRLAFQANNSATVNVWTNLGQPAFTTGVWNSQNYTTTLTLNDASTEELNWNTYNITTYADAHSNVSPSNVTVAYGGSQTLNFSATQGYIFSVTVDGAPQGQISTYTFTNVTAPHTVNVTSTQLFTITASAGSGGSITPSGSVVVGYGQTQQFNFTANTGYHISKILVDNASQGTPPNYTFSNIQANHTITVSFAINVYNITASADAHSTITPGNVSINHGEYQLFNITADPGYYISHVYVDGEDQGKISSYNFTNVQSNHTISVSSAALAPTPTPSPSPTPTPSPSPSPTSTPTPAQTNPFPTETVALVAAAITIVIAVFALALKKGYITIEIVDEENPEEAPT